MDSQSQFLTSHAIFNHHAYTKWVVRIISCKFSSFSICDVASRSTFPMPQTLRPNICNNCSEANLTKVGFSNCGHCSTIITRLFHFALGFGMITTNSLLIISPLHGHGISQYANIHFNTVLMSRTSFKSWRPPRFGFLVTKPCTSFKCLVNNHLA